MFVLLKCQNQTADSGSLGCKFSEFHKDLNLDNSLRHKCRFYFGFLFEIMAHVLIRIRLNFENLRWNLIPDRRYADEVLTHSNLPVQLSDVLCRTHVHSRRCRLNNVLGQSFFEI